MRTLLVVCLALVSRLAHAQVPARVEYDTTMFERDIRTRLAAFEGCQRDQLRVGEPTEGRVRIAVTVRTNGQVWPATVVEDTTGNAVLAGCVRSSFLGMRIARPPGMQQAFTFQITFRPNGLGLGSFTGGAPPDAPPAPRVQTAAPQTAIAEADALERAEGLGVPRRRGDLDASVVNPTMRGSSGAIRRCYEYELRASPALAGKVTVAFTILEGGEVDHVTIDENTTGSDTLASCVAAAIDGLQFSPGPVGGSVFYRYPFVFSPQN